MIMLRSMKVLIKARTMGHGHTVYTGHPSIWWWQLQPHNENRKPDSLLSNATPQAQLDSVLLSVQPMFFAVDWFTVVQ